MRIDWLIPAEGVTADSRGAMAVVGFNQHVLTPDRFPFSTKGVVVGQISGDGEDALRADRRLFFQFVVQDPDGTTLFATNGETVLGPKPHPNGPSLISVSLDYQVTVSKPGEHRLCLRMTTEEGDAAEGGTSLWVQPALVVHG